MYFIVIAHDQKDKNAYERRMAVRESHLKFADKMFKEGKWSFASALLDDEGKMNGSVILCDYPSKEELKKQWLDKEAYVLNDVWGEIIISRAHPAKINQ